MQTYWYVVAIRQCITAARIPLKLQPNILERLFTEYNGHTIHDTAAANVTTDVSTITAILIIYNVLLLNTGVNANLELVDKFCYSGDMLSEHPWRPEFKLDEINSGSQ